ncbi:hypothetical protein HN51_058199 [Arachis hypogaea]|uniref:Kinetochore protein SPC25 n=1 Tax=Arachis hypogaea TaxID=3818 RepID=A0A444WZV0_ARAHY|nr:kinetochore protein SPC25 homolog isoform X1 [Arachis hypogaea]QHN81402.1 Kinetochore protein [Arachis hypogaea]RYQ82987.1 hypothetical protein Ahy_B10g101597 [Arachis hypogaea]
MELSVSSICDSEIPLQLRKIDDLVASSSKSLQSLKSTAHETAQLQGKLEEAKGKVREAEDDLVKAIAVKTRKEAKRMALSDAIASAKARVEGLKASIQQQQTKKQEFAEFLARQSLALAASEGRSNERIEQDETQEAISWYNRVLGFHVEGGHGVKFTFKNINMNNPNEEYSFTIRHENNTYTLLSCEPSLENTEDLIHELNKTNGLFKFARVMRKKFQEAVTQGGFVQTTVEHEESMLMSASAPVLSMSSARSDTTAEGINDHVEPVKVNSNINKQHIQRRVNSGILSPGSASSIRRSPRLKATR